MPPRHSHPPIIAHAAPLLADYDVMFCDVWGVLHDGHQAFDSACDALLRFKDAGGTVVLVSNAPVPEVGVATMLDKRGVPRAAYDAIVASGDIALRHVADKGYQRVYCIGPADRDSLTFKQLTAERADLDTADAILCTGLNNDRTETAETYRPLLERARACNLPFVCANPDLVVDVGGHQYLCAGAIADLYERMDGEVFWAGKPHANAYATARATAEGLRGKPVPLERIIAIGDSLRTDLKGAQAYGIPAVFVASGIHREETMGDGTLRPAVLERLFTPPAPVPLAVMERLAW
jgi:HAD superfamily hydrolase (TIGR01459 family)